VHRAAVFHFLAPGATFNLNFAGSQILVQQIQAGAPADVVATADEASMRTLSTANLLATNAFLFAHNRLTIMTAKGNPKNIQSLADLARPVVKVDLCAAVVPCGKFALQILATAKVSVTPVSQETDVKGVVTKVATGEADAGITYVTDALAAQSTTDSVRIPDENNVINAYPRRRAPHGSRRPTGPVLHHLPVHSAGSGDHGQTRIPAGHLTATGHLPPG
jgi:molybdate transport system substrate-binding protein